MPSGTEPLLDSLQLTCSGAVVPHNATNGWSFDPVTDCFTFHGTYADVQGPCSVSYF